MKIATDAEHRALAYMVAVAEQGVAVSKDDLAAYVKHPRGAGWSALFSVSNLTPPAEGTVERLLRYGWLDEEDGVMHATALGVAVLRALDREELDSEVPLEVVLRADDPFAYAKVVSRLASHDEAMLVDPYVRVEQFADVVRHTTVSRLLVGPNTELQGLRVAMRMVPEGRPLEVKVSESLHDRLFIPKSGAVDLLGVSLNGVGKKVTVLMTADSPVADHLRTVYEEAWAKAAPLEDPPGVQ